MQKFIEKIVSVLESNGFPEKKVSLPTEKMFEAADNKGLSFNKVLDEMKLNLSIESDIGDDKVIFSKQLPQGENPFEGMDQDEMMKKAQDMMSQMDPAELEKMKNMFATMSDEEKDDIMEKGKNMGLV